jgi:hypothetical protein
MQKQAQISLSRMSCKLAITSKLLTYKLEQGEAPCEAVSVQANQMTTFLNRLGQLFQ